MLLTVYKIFGFVHDGEQKQQLKRVIKKKYILPRVASRSEDAA